MAKIRCRLKVDGSQLPALKLFAALGTFGGFGEDRVAAGAAQRVTTGQGNALPLIVKQLVANRTLDKSFRHPLKKFQTIFNEIFFEKNNSEKKNCRKNFFELFLN